MQKLIADPVREGKGIEYKSKLNLKTEDAKRKFLASIASFANAGGGDMVIGIKTEIVEKGLPISIEPLAGFNPDADILRLRDIIRAHIKPKVFTIDYKPVDVNQGQALLSYLASKVAAKEQHTLLPHPATSPEWKKSGG